MSRLVKLRGWFWIGLLLSTGARTLIAEKAGNPYQAIAERNVFRLEPPQRQLPAPPPAPLITVKLVGITTMCGKRALLIVHLPATPSEPAKAVACVLKVGEREGEVEVLEIDEAGGSVKIRNSGAVMVIWLAKGSRRPPSLLLTLNLPPVPVQSRPGP